MGWFFLGGGGWGGGGGMGVVNRDLEIRNLMLAMDRGNVANQSMFQLAQMRALPPEGIEVWNPNAFMKKVLPKLGFKDVQNYFFKINNPPPEEGTNGGGLNSAFSGQVAPQPLARENELQMGGMGGV